MILQWETPLHHLPSSAQVADVVAEGKTRRFGIFRMMGRQCSVKLDGKFLGKHKDMAAAKQWAEENAERLLKEIQ